jgi:hypothetical protein
LCGAHAVADGRIEHADAYAVRWGDTRLPGPEARRPDADVRTGPRDGDPGDVKAATANRAKLLADLQSLRARATDPQPQPALDSFIAAIRESLRQNRECGAKCSPSDLSRVDSLKQQVLSRLSPLLRRYVGRTYRSQEV